MWVLIVDCEVYLFHNRSEMEEFILLVKEYYYTHELGKPKIQFVLASITTDVKETFRKNFLEEDDDKNW
jgi:hypothetical protein